MSLLTLADLRVLVETDIDDLDLQAVIDREEAEIIRMFGPHPDGTTAIEEEHAGGGRNIYLQHPIVSVSSVAEQYLGQSASTVQSSSYHVWKGQGRVERVPRGSRWAELVTVSYVPADERPKRKAVLIELLRLAVERTAMKLEDVADEYRYQAPDWEQERDKLLRRLISFQGV